MPDCYVKKLYYDVIPGKGVDYDEAEPYTDETDEFEVKVQDEIAEFQMSEGFGTVEEARAVVERYLEQWKIIIGLQNDPGDLSFRYRSVEIETAGGDEDDLKRASCDISMRAGITAQAYVCRGAYPAPPRRFDITPDVKVMYERYKSFRNGEEPLPSMAYFCLTCLQNSAGDRESAAEEFRVSRTVLNTMGKLSSTRGSVREARKHPDDGEFRELSSTAKNWLRTAVKKVIYRVGEHAAVDREELERITMDDLPDFVE